MERIHRASPAEAVKHPTWSMGAKISVDSATMMNKALEVIEARYLFGVQSEQIDVVIHPQSVIHSMVQYKDASVVAQLGTPDMRVPIAYGLSWPERVVSGASALDFRQLAPMTFESLDVNDHAQRFPGLQLAWDSLRAPFGTCAVLNAANEMAVAAFLDHRIRFNDIHAVNQATLASVQFAVPDNLEALLDLDRLSRAQAAEQIRHLER
jgi:1-deoxy-D-xylulose-5-phosphate reductoisomerase